MSIRKVALGFILFIVFVVGVPVFVGTTLWVRMTDLYRGYSETEQFVEIPQGAGTADIGQRLVDAGVVKDTWTFRAAVSPVFRISRRRCTPSAATTGVAVMVS